MYTNGGNDEDGYEENDKGEGMYTNGEFVEDGDEECGEGENDKGEGVYTNGEIVEDGNEECGEGENDKVEGMCGEDFFFWTIEVIIILTKT